MSRNLSASAAIMAAFVAACFLGCGKGTSRSTIVRIEPGPDAQERIQTALISAQSGDTIELAEGTFNCIGTLSLDVEKVVFRGQGKDRTILNFAEAQQGTGGEGLLVTSNDFTLEDLAIEDVRGDAVKISGADGVTLRRVRVEWTGGPKETNGSYGLYPVLCSNVLIEDCVARGASDAGIYVGQSRNIIVRRNRATQNVAGIEIENSIRCDVYDNVLTDNAAGILVFTLPDLPKKQGRHCRVFHNQIKANNHPNFAPRGNIVAMVPPGSGLMIMASDQVEVFENTLHDNQTVNLAVISYQATQREQNDQRYDPYPESIHVHNNQFSGGGDKPQGELGVALGLLLGGRLPDILYDGAVDPGKLVDGKLPPELRLCIHDNGDADFAKVDLAKLDVSSLVSSILAPSNGAIQRDLKAHAGQHAALSEVRLARAGR